MVSRLPTPTKKRPLQTRFRSGSRGSCRLTLPATATRRFIMQKARRHPPFQAGSDSLWAHGFRFSFTPLAGSFSPFPRGTCALSVSWEYLALPDGPGCFTQGSSCPALLRIPLPGANASPTGLSPSPARPSSRFRSRQLLGHRGPTTPATAPRGTARVWATPRSLATTKGITVVFSSWGY